MINISDSQWFNHPATRLIVDQFYAHGHENDARFVGGCVRNTLMRKEINDIDIATTMLPEDVIALFKPSFNVIETGLKHGTVTVMANGVPFEITTLRKDVNTDGRHADVEFITDWAIDAQRRDFTVNGLYADLDGNVIDLVDGIKDIKTGTIRFIGNAKDRIEEDYLRILRFFRFHAWYGNVSIDTNGLAWAGMLKDGLSQISAERISSEMLKLFASPNKAMMTSCVRDMNNVGILEQVIPRFSNLQRFFPLQKMDPDPILSLVSMMPNHTQSVREAANALRLSSDQTKRMVAAVIDDGAALRDTSDVAIRRNTYIMGAQAFADQIRLLYSRTRQENEAEKLKDIIDRAFSWERPKMPITGADLIAAGMTPGKSMGQMLSAMETRWIESDFKLQKEDLL